MAICGNEMSTAVQVIVLQHISFMLSENDIGRTILTLASDWLGSNHPLKQKSINISNMNMIST